MRGKGKTMYLIVTFIEDTSIILASVYKIRKNGEEHKDYKNQ